MTFDKRQLSKEAKALNFVRDTYEKVIRLIEILRIIQENEPFCTCLALKGGTAINLTLFDLPRLSVDIDLDYDGNEEKDIVMEKRSFMNKALINYMKKEGYEFSPKSKEHYALDSYVFSYVNAGGQKDNIKIDINYSLRTHLLPTTFRKIRVIPCDNLYVKTLHPIEIFAGKTNALFTRCMPRDMYDYYQMIHMDLFDENEKILLRKCSVFYKAVSAKDDDYAFQIDKINDVRQVDIKRYLFPVIHQSEFVDVKKMQNVIMDYYQNYLQLDKQDTAFLENFKKGEYLPQLLFSNEIVERIDNHPMIQWKLK